jgi:hypothetical protein
MSIFSKIVATTLNNPLSPLKTFDFALFQIPKQRYFKYPKILYFKLKKTLFQTLEETLL